MSVAAQESASPASAWGTSASASGVTESNQNRHKITESRHTMGCDLSMWTWSVQGVWPKSEGCVHVGCGHE